MFGAESNGSDRVNDDDSVRHGEDCWALPTSHMNIKTISCLQVRKLHLRPVFFFSMPEINPVLMEHAKLFNYRIGL